MARVHGLPTIRNQPLQGFAPALGAGLDWATAENKASGQSFCNARFEMVVPADLTKRRLYIYNFVSSDSSKTVEFLAQIEFWHENSKVGSLPLYYLNVPALSGFGTGGVVNKSTVNWGFASPNGQQNGVVIPNCLELSLWRPIAQQPGYDLGETNGSVVVEPYEIDLAFDRVMIPAFAASDYSFSARLWIGILSYA